MKPLGPTKDHVMLVKRMAQATDLNLCDAYAEGMLSQKSWAELVQTCRGCQWTGQCDAWLSRHEDESCAPDPCLNRARFADLRRQQKET